MAAASASFSLYDESNELEKVFWSISEDFVENPLTETQFFIRIHVSTSNTWFGPSIKFQDDDDDDELYVTRQANLPPVVIEFPLSLLSSSSSPNVYGDIDALVSNHVISLAFSEKIKSTLSSCRPMVAEIALKKKHRWILLVLVAEIERVYFEVLKTKKFEKEEDLARERTRLCGICLDEFSMGRDFITQMPCSHVFHPQCIFSWLEKKNTCPLCRRPTTS